MPIFVLTDCRYLYDVFQKIAPQLEEKRTLLDVLAIKQTLKQEGLRWIPTTEMLADVLTKIDKDLMVKLALFIGGATIALTDSE